MNFALNLEYFEAEFYTYATTGKSITNFGIGIDGQSYDENSPTGGTMTGGSQVSFINDEVFSRKIVEEIATDERAHVAFIREALGARPLPSLTLISMLKTPEIIAAASWLLAAEADHAGSIRTQIAWLKVLSSPVDGAV